jgi:MoaA/NifB/PqqE/SkfB family radical SAM enzyme
MPDKNSYKRTGDKFLKDDEQILNLFSDPGEFIISNPENFNTAPVFKLLSPVEIILSQLQNLFHGLLQFYLNDADNNSDIEVKRLNLDKAAKLINILCAYTPNSFEQLRSWIGKYSAELRISETSAAEYISLFYKEFENIILPAGTRAVTIDIDEIPEFDAKEYLDEPVLLGSLTELNDLVIDLQQYLSCFLLHGSLATLDYVYGSSDCDSLAILNRQTAVSPSALLELRAKNKVISNLFKEIDPFQHHGIYVYTEQDMKYFPQTWLPLVLMDYSKVLYAADNYLNYSIRPSLIERRTDFWNITYGMRHDWICGNFPSDLFALKQYVQVALLMPIFYYELHGAFIYKKHLYTLLRKEIPDNLYSLIEQATKLRNSNLYIKALKEADEDIAGHDMQVDIPEWLKRELYPDMLGRSAELIETLFENEKQKFLSTNDIWEDELLHLPQCAGGEGDLWANFISDESGSISKENQNESNCFAEINGASYLLTDFPQKFEMDFYDSVKKKYVDTIVQCGGIQSIYQMGTVSVPGLSDMDFIIVINDKFGKNELKLCIDSFFSLSEQERYVIKHPPSAFINAELLSQISWLHPTFSLVHIYGDDILQTVSNQAPPLAPQQAPPENQLINLVELFLMEFPIEFMEEMQKKELSVRNHLMRMKSLSLSVKIMEMNKIVLPDRVGAFINNSVQLFKNWFTYSETENLEQLQPLFAEAETIMYELIFLLKDKLVQLGYTVKSPDRFAGVYAGKVFFISDWSANTAKYLSDALLERHGYACSVLPAEFLSSIISHSNTESELGKRIRTSFMINKDVRSFYSPVLKTRADILERHYTLLKSRDMNGGVFYPYHFSPDYWQSDLITWRWKKEIEKCLADGMDFSENFVLKSIIAWNKYIVKPSEIISDKESGISCAFAEGFYPEENGIRWIAKKGKFFITLNNAAVISFTVTNMAMACYKTSPLVITIKVNDVVTNKIELKNNYQTAPVEIAIDGTEPEYEITIESSGSFIPRDLNINSDLRELSVYVKSLKAEIIPCSKTAAPVIPKNKNDDKDLTKDAFNFQAFRKNDIQKMIVEAEKILVQKNFSGARKILDKLLSIAPDNPDALNDMGIIEILENNPYEALRYFNKALLADPGNIAAKENIEYVFALNGNINAPIDNALYVNNIIHEADIMTYSAGNIFSFIDHIDKLTDNLTQALKGSFSSATDANLFIAKITNLLVLKYQYFRKHNYMLAKPFGLLLDPSNGCNLHCPGCLHDVQDKKDFLWENGLLSLETYKKYLNSFGPYATHILFFNYGEPFINKQTPEFIALAKEYKLFTSLSTNLSLPIDAEAIVNSGLDYLVFSVDGASAKTYEKYRKGGKFELVMENMKKLVEAKKKYGLSKPTLVWQFLIFNHNKHEIDLAVNTAKEIGIDEINLATPFDVSAADPEITIPAEVKSLSKRISFLRNWNNSSDKWEKESHNNVELNYQPEKTWTTLLNSFPQNELSKSEPENKYTCEWLYKNIVMDAHGNIIPCCAPPTKNRNLIFPGLLKHNSSEELFNSSMYFLARQSFSDNKSYKEEIEDLETKDIPYCNECGGNNSSLNVDNSHLQNYLLNENLFRILTKENVLALTNW